MTNRQAIEQLIEAVEAGNITDTGVDRFSCLPRRGGGVYADPNWYDAHAAYWRGSLDAAKALHEAMLPGWMPDMQMLTDGKWLVQMWDPVGSPCEISEENISPAHAWLLAILKAKLAEATQ